MCHLKIAINELSLIEFDYKCKVKNARVNERK